MTFRHFRVKLGVLSWKVVGQGLVWMYHPGICVVWLRK